MVDIPESPQDQEENNPSVLQHSLEWTIIIAVALATVFYIVPLLAGNVRTSLVTWVVMLLPTVATFVVTRSHQKERKIDVTHREMFRGNALNHCDIVSMTLILGTLIYVYFWIDADQVIFYAPQLTLAALMEITVVCITVAFCIYWLKSRKIAECNKRVNFRAHLGLQIAKSMGYIPVLVELLWFRSDTEPFFGWFLYWVASCAGLYLAWTQRGSNGNRLAFLYAMRPVCFIGLIILLQVLI